MAKITLLPSDAKDKYRLSGVVKKDDVKSKPNETWWIMRTPEIGEEEYRIVVRDNVIHGNELHVEVEAITSLDIEIRHWKDTEGWYRINVVKKPR
jgi:hypothetical protein